MIVVADQRLQLEDIAGGIHIETNDGQIELVEPRVLEPCVEFTRFMTSRPDASARKLKPDRKKLRNGVRGFVVGVGGPDPIEVGMGDTLSVRTV